MDPSLLLGMGLGGMSPWGLGIGIGGSLLSGALNSRRQKKDKRKMLKRLNRAIGVTESIQGKGLQQQDALSRLATQQRLGGYDVARKEAARLGRGGKRQALDREQQMNASLSQGLANRGLGSTTVGANLQRGIASDTSRQMASIDEGLAGIYGDLALGRAGAEAAGTDQLSSIAGQQADLASQLAQMRLLGGGQLGQAGMQVGMGSIQPGYEMALPGIMEQLGGFMGGQGGGLDPRILQYLFSQGGDMGLGAFGIGDTGHELLQGPLQANGRY